jgi:hypothetical protein
MLAGLRGGVMPNYVWAAIALVFVVIAFVILMNNVAL